MLTCPSGVCLQGACRHCEQGLQLAKTVLHNVPQVLSKLALFLALSTACQNTGCGFVSSSAFLQPCYKGWPGFVIAVCRKQLSTVRCCTCLDLMGRWHARNAGPWIHEFRISSSIHHCLVPMLPHTLRCWAHVTHFPLFDLLQLGVWTLCLCPL